LWEARAKLIQKYGWPAGNQLALQLVTDGMNLSPPNPNFLEARDAILQANLVDNGGLDLNELWAAFAKRGMGYSASSPASSTTSGVIEAFNLPADPLSLLPTGGLSSSGKLGGPFFPATETFTLINLGTNPLNWTAGTTVPWLGLSASAGGLPTQNSSTTVTAFFNSAANALPKGIYSGALRFTNTSSGAIFTRSAKLVVGRSVVAWGDTSRGANEPDSVFDVVAVACGSYDTLCLKRDGTVFGWGANYDGQTNVPPGLSNVAAISMGVSHSLALKSDGTVSAWGSDYRTQTEIPADLANVIGIAAGGYHSLALRCDGTLTAWGAGKTVAYPSDGLNYGQAIVPAGLSNVVAIAAGWGHSLALKADGTVAGWGANYYGQSSVPFGLNNVVAIAAGEDHSLALKADGSVVAWGVNYDGETTIPPGLANVAAVAAGGSHSLALVTNGTVTAWGFDAYGEVEVPTGLSNVVAVAAGWYHSVALLNDGTLSSPFIYQQPHDCVSLVGKSVVFNVGAVGTPALQYQWTKGGVTLSNGKNVSGVNSSTLVLYAVAEADEGSYAVIITNPNGSVTSSNAFLTVLDPGIATQPAGSTNLYGTTASFSVIASGSSPLRYQWRKNGTDLVNGGNISGATTPTLTVSSVQPSDAASYTVLVRNHKGSIVSVVAYLRVITTPEITRQPLSRNKWMGQNVSLTMSGRGATPLNYRWLKDATGAPLSEPARFLTDGGKISGATTPTLTLSNLSFPEAGDYQAVLSNVWGSVTSAPAHLAVSTARGHVVAWGGNDYGQTNVPSGLTNVVMIDAGGYHSMALKSDGTVVEWGDSQWIPASQNNVAALDGSQGLDLILKGDGTIGAWGWSFFGETNIPAGLSNVVAVSAGYNFSVALKDDGTVAAWGGNPGGMGNYLGQLSDVVAISAGDDHLLALKRDGTVTALGEDFIGQTEVPAGLTNVVAVAAGGKHSLALKADATVIAWGANYYGQANVPAGLSNVVAIAAGLGNSMAVKSDGTVVNWGTGDQGLNLTPPSWLSNVTAAAGAYAHGLALVNDLLPPAIAVAAASRTNNASVTATFTVTATGAAPLAYQWKRNGANMVDGGNISGANSSALSLANVLKATEGSYSVLVSNIAGLALSADAVLTVLDPAITSLPTSRTNLAGTTATFSASVSGTPALNLQWLKNGVKLVDGGKVSGAGTTNLALSAVDQTDAASYSVVVSNVIGSVTSSPPAVLVVIDPPAITAQPASRTNIAGSSASFSVGAGGTGPLRYQWRKDGGNLPNGGKISGATTATLLITTVAQTEAASYSVVITNLGGSVTSSPPALLTVLDPPAITSQPASRTNIAGTTATFGVAAIGTAPLSFQWLKNGVKMVEGGRIFGTAGTNLTVTSVDQTDAGSYAVVVTNAAGSITSSPSAVLTVIDPPAISAQPLSRTNLARSTVTFAITASGSAPLSYQWQKEGAPLTNGGRVLGATSSALTLASLVKADQGNYRAVVTNLGGSVTSAEARLTVLDAVYAFTRFATEVGPASARLNGMVDPVGSAASAWFEWGTNTSYGHSTSPQDVGAGQSVVYFSFVLGGLGHGAIIHYRSVASNDTQVLYGPDQQFITGGRARAWGDDSSGQVSIPAGVSDVTDVAGGLSHSLARRTDASVTGWGNNTYGQGLIPAAATNVAAITAGGFHNLALLTNGTVLGWGRSDFGQATAPTGLSNVVALAAGGSHSLALRGDGSIAAWGYNAQGQTTLPVGLSNVVGLAAGWYHSLALRSDGTVQAWGNNTYGQCSVPAGLTNVVWIGAGLYHSLALRRDGTMAAWGYNGSGQTSLPADLTNVVAAACGGYHNLALRSDASLLGWGYNFYGQATPPADATNFVVLAAGGSHSLAIAPSLPLPAAPVLSVALSHWNTNGFDLRFTGASNATYRVWASTNFLNWTPLGTAQSLGTGWFDYLDSTATNWPRRFYKAGAP
jgi:alpha-tubulin suppressor-like RCC1 family protein